MNPLELRGITKRRDGFNARPARPRRATRVRHGLRRANGAGKTTTIKIALGLFVRMAATVGLLDHARVGVVQDAPAYVGEWSAAEVGRAAGPFYPDWDAAGFAQLLAWAGIDPTKRVKALSRGMGDEAPLGGDACATWAELLILDEPTSGLDPLARSELLDMVAEFMTVRCYDCRGREL